METDLEVGLLVQIEAHGINLVLTGGESLRSSGHAVLGAVQHGECYLGLACEYVGSFVVALISLIEALSGQLIATGGQILHNLRDGEGGAPRLCAHVVVVTACEVLVRTVGADGPGCGAVVAAEVGVLDQEVEADIAALSLVHHVLQSLVIGQDAEETVVGQGLAEHQLEALAITGGLALAEVAVRSLHPSVVLPLPLADAAESKDATALVHNRPDAVHALGGACGLVVLHGSQTVVVGVEVGTQVLVGHADERVHDVVALTAGAGYKLEDAGVRADGTLGAPVVLGAEELVGLYIHDVVVHTFLNHIYSLHAPRCEQCDCQKK